VGDSALAIDVGAVLDADDTHDAFLREYPVGDPLSAASRRVIPLDRSLKWLTDDARGVEQRTDEKLHDRGGHLRRKPGERSLGCWRNLEAPGAHRCRYFVRSSSAVTALPASRSASALRIARIAFGSDTSPRLRRRTQFPPTAPSVITDASWSLQTAVTPKGTNQTADPEAIHRLAFGHARWTAPDRPGPMGWRIYHLHCLWMSDVISGPTHAAEVVLGEVDEATVTIAHAFRNQRGGICDLTSPTRGITSCSSRSSLP